MSSHLIIPEGYRSSLTTLQTELAIKLCKDTFERSLANSLNLTRVSAPLFVRPESGLNDNLNGVERPVSFDIPAVGCTAEIVHSLAKWKRMALRRYGFSPMSGLYTDMNAIRRDESLDNLHSIYVDQWDWERVITEDIRTMDTLKATVNEIYKSILSTQQMLKSAFPALSLKLPDHVTFISSQHLLDLYPTLSPKERENSICKEFGTVFISQIGGKLSDGKSHDGRAPDYDDWSLNGDLLMWYPLLDCAMEISSMGIRVDEKSLSRQLKLSGASGRASLPFHSLLLSGGLPLTIGGGIGQSRICMLLLEKAHVGEVQVSIWDDEMIETCKEHRIYLL